MKHLNTISGFFTSVKLPQVLTIPITKNSTSRAQPMAWRAPLMPWMTVQTAPPLNSSRVVLRSCQLPIPGSQSGVEVVHDPVSASYIFITFLRETSGEGAGVPSRCRTPQPPVIMEGRSLVTLEVTLSLSIEELIFITGESRSVREPFFPLFS